MSGLKGAKVFSLSLPQFLQGVRKPKSCPILPFRGFGLQTEQQIKNLKDFLIPITPLRHRKARPLQLQDPRGRLGPPKYGWLELGILPTHRAALQSKVFKRLGPRPCLNYLLKTYHPPLRQFLHGVKMWKITSQFFTKFAFESSSFRKQAKCRKSQTCVWNANDTILCSRKMWGKSVHPTLRLRI